MFMHSFTHFGTGNSCYNAIWAFPCDCLSQNIETEGFEGSAGALSHPSFSAHTVAEGGWPLHHPGCRMVLEYQKPFRAGERAAGAQGENDRKRGSGV